MKKYRGKNKFLKQQGLSMIELIVAISVLSIGLIGVLSLVMQNVKVQYINKNILIASQLAQEGIELVRGMRDENWITDGNDWDTDIVNDGTYIIDYLGRGSIDDSINSITDVGAKLYINDSGFYTHTYFPTETIFSRLISVSDEGDYLDVVCNIEWQSKAQTHQYSAETHLYDWR